MKGLSVFLTIALLVLASQLAGWLKENGKLPRHDGQKETPGLTYAKGPAHRPVRQNFRS